MRPHVPPRHSDNTAACKHLPRHGPNREPQSTSIAPSCTSCPAQHAGCRWVTTTMSKLPAPNLRSMLAAALSCSDILPRNGPRTDINAAPRHRRFLPTPRPDPRRAARTRRPPTTRAVSPTKEHASQASSFPSKRRATTQPQTRRKPSVATRNASDPHAARHRDLPHLLHMDMLERTATAELARPSAVPFFAARPRSLARQRTLASRKRVAAAT